jgi:hypothetical protein
MERMVEYLRCVDIGAAVDLDSKLAPTEAVRDVMTMEDTEIRALVKIPIGDNFLFLSDGQ